MDAHAQLDRFIDKFAPETAALARALLARMRARLPGATILVYDNYNALAIGFGATDKASKAVLSLAVYPRWVNLFFLQAAGLRDPKGLLGGKGRKVRHIRMLDAEAIDDSAVDALIAQAVAASDPPFDPAAPQRLIVKSVSPKQRQRR